jgi:hypothetical protein
VVRAACVWILLLTGLPAVCADWKRYFGTGPLAETWDEPAPHALSYFELHPCARADPQDRIIRCAALPGSGVVRSRARSKTAAPRRSLRATLGPYKIYDLDYPLSPPLRSILAQTGRDEFREIYVLEAIGGAPPPPTRLISAQALQLLEVRIPSHSSKRGFFFDYLELTAGSLRLVNFSRVYAAADGALPPHLAVALESAAFDWNKQEWRAAAFDPEHHSECCQGAVRIRFRLEDAVALVENVRYEPEGQ